MRLALQTLTVNARAQVRAITLDDPAVTDIDLDLNLTDVPRSPPSGGFAIGSLLTGVDSCPSTPFTFGVPRASPTGGTSTLTGVRNPKPSNLNPQT